MGLQVTVMKDFYYNAGHEKFVLALESTDPDLADAKYTLTHVTGLGFPPSSPLYSQNKRLLETPANPDNYYLIGREYRKLVEARL